MSSQWSYKDFWYSNAADSLPEGNHVVCFPSAKQNYNSFHWRCMFKEKYCQQHQELKDYTYNKTIKYYRECCCKILNWKVSCKKASIYIIFSSSLSVPSPFCSNPKKLFFLLSDNVSNPTQAIMVTYPLEGNEALCCHLYCSLLHLLKVLQYYHWYSVMMQYLRHKLVH